MFRYIEIVFAAVFYLTCISQPGHGYRILCIFPAPSISHQFVFRSLTSALHKRGHELVIVTPNPINDPTLANYTEIDTSFGYETLFTSIKYVESRGKSQWTDYVQKNGHQFYNYMDRIFNLPELRKLYGPGSNEQFDLVMVEFVYWQGMYPFAARFDAPMIGITTLALAINTLYTTGNPLLSSHPSNWEIEAESSEDLSIWQRVQNFIRVWKYLYWFKTEYVPTQAAIAKKYLGNDIPDLHDLEKNVSLVFVNQQAPISYARPNIPKIIEIGGFHVSKETVKLSKDLQEILDGATTGFIYVSLGSNVKSNLLPNKTKDVMITAFSRLPYEVLWKFEDDVLPGQPGNVHIMKWVPQQAVLAHPNLKAFVYQGGVQSTEEAVYHAVPLIGFPLLWDQDMQVNKMVSLGVAKKLEITTIGASELFNTISTVASDPSYKQRMLELRSLITDKPYDPLENAIWWTEHVIRHRGAPQLHSSTADEPWYRRQDMDVVALLSAGFMTVLGLTLIILYQLIGSVFHHTASAGTLHAKKIN